MGEKQILLVDRAAVGEIPGFAAFFNWEHSPEMCNLEGWNWSLNNLKYHRREPKSQQKNWKLESLGKKCNDSKGKPQISADN